MSDTTPPPEGKEPTAAGSHAEEAPRSFADVKRTVAGAGDEAGAEETLWRGRTSWKHYGGLVLAYAVSSAAVLIASAIWLGAGWWRWSVVLGVVLLAGVVIAVRLAIIVFGTRYELTTERLFIERGLVRLTRDQTELIRVDDVRVRKLLFDRVFHLGTVQVMSTDLSDRSVVIEGVADADRVAELIRSRMRTARKKSLFIENL